ncbi:MAG: hypothetical protein A3A33_02315 [Candidatus Yanofskybacteria bacterium RIFCSPLOWO2_01_FULL_49_25]|uniref:Uncharacterized protein n=1 Tax=Candidatus Yanofskybacteria bacterium RIFCSPLOWO2_01_FULL_49_25 TaxID=1802701 RepID=A0A1F8GU48_9BACT|nr:MAG: hypothetical protein A3A33_02315 [Candidatus Yanofskybacteria bacterium RIFCSPLOWO2_01_FULL_49_25]
MGTQFTHNDSLQITREQGFPKELVYEEHLKKPFTAGDFKGREFEFHDKAGLRFYQAPPVRNFLIENRDGKWLYWGLIHVLELHLDYIKKTVSGTFRITYVNTPDEMKQAHGLIDRDPETDFFG